MEERAAFLAELVRDAGRLALTHFNSRLRGAVLKGAQDPVTEADMAVEDLIRRTLRDRFPDDGFLGEESGHRPGDCLWVVDPIDGTDNFARDIPHFCISVAIVAEGRTQAGAIYNPVTDEMYLARRDMGATKNGRAISVSSTPSMATAAVELGWSTRVSRAEYLATLNAFLDAGANVRRAGSGALALAWVAEGRLDGYAELHMNAWDALAGLLLVVEAGGVVCDGADRAPQLWQGGAVFASSPALAPHVIPAHEKAA